ncbi:limbin isoform X2 [Phyllostomus hastatus]|uniref:limbin isoform X2 n=1 Tax=Phyllostomus hastatus TaxID=9423 RepID=UPI001E67E41B|nr:limbin isoform X2 [Phyllostomus hastatus]
MGSAAAPGRAAWVLAGGLLAAALALPAGSRGRGWLPVGPSPLQRPQGAQAPRDRPEAPGAGPERAAQHGDISRDVQGTPENGVIFQKCAVVLGPSVAQTAQVRLLVNNTPAPAAADLSDLLLLDNVTGLAVRESPGNRTAAGFQAFARKFLAVGTSFSVSYTASLEAGDIGHGEVLALPAQLTFQSSSPNRTQLRALFTVTVEEKVLPNHGLHAAGFFVAFVVSLALTWVTLFFLVRYWCLKGSVLSRHQGQHHESKPEHALFTSADAVDEDLALNDQMVGILSSEDPGSMPQALEELEIATLNRADSDLEACRTQISQDVIALLLRGLTGRGHLSPPVERRMAALFKKQFLLLEKEIQEEYDRKMVALTAECDLETRKKMETQYQREMAAMEEAEELLKRVSERSAAECSGLLRTLHGLEQQHLRRSLALQQEEDFAKARRQLAVFQRNELHSIFFAQIKSAIFKGDLKPEAAELLLQDYSNVQEEVEELMDFFQASKRYHLSKRFGHREYLVQNIQSSEARAQGLLSTAAAQLTLLVQKHERAGYLDEDQTEALLERAQTEVFSIKQKLDNDLKQEKKKLHQRLIMRRRREMLQKHKEQRREQLAVGDAFRAAEDVGQYLGQWRSLVAEHSAALEELQERLDQAALDDLRALTLSLFERATEELRRLQNSVVTQELLKRGVPWLFLQQALEEQGRELAARAEQLEGAQRDRDQEGVQGVRQRLKEDAPEASAEEQAELRRWGRLVFARLRAAAFSLSEEELLRMRRDLHGCCAQMDRSLALPRIRARVLLQRLQAAWREAESLKLDQALAAPELQQQSRARKPRAKSKSKTDLLRKCIEDKIQLFDGPAPEDLVEKVRGELLRERVQQLEAQEGRFAESLASLQFQKAARAARTLRAYTALLGLQDLLLEELRMSETLTPAACAQVLESHSPVRAPGAGEEAGGPAGPAGGGAAAAGPGQLAAVGGGWARAPERARAHGLREAGVRCAAARPEQEPEVAGAPAAEAARGARGQRRAGGRAGDDGGGHLRDPVRPGAEAGLVPVQADHGAGRHAAPPPERGAAHRLAARAAGRARVGQPEAAGPRGGQGRRRGASRPGQEGETPGLVAGLRQQTARRARKQGVGAAAVGPPEEGERIEEDTPPPPREGAVLREGELAAPVPRGQRRAGARARGRGGNHGPVPHGREALRIQKPEGSGDLPARPPQEKEELPERQEGRLGLGRGLAAGRRRGKAPRRLQGLVSPAHLRVCSRCAS